MNKLVIVVLVSSMLVAACFATSADPAKADESSKGSETGAEDLDTAQQFFGGWGGGYRRFGGYGYGGGWGRRRFYGGYGGGYGYGWGK